MVRIPGLSFLHRSPAPLQRETASGAAPRDVVTLSGRDDAARARRMWPEMARVGIQAAASGPIGASLTDALRGDLLALFTALGEKGVRFYPSTGPAGASNPAEPALTPAATMDTIADTGVRGLYVGADDRGRFPLESVEDLQALDAIHLAGDAAGLGTHPEVARALHGLEGAGFGFHHTMRNGLTWEAVDPLAVFRFAAREPGQRTVSRAIRVEGPRGNNLLEETDDPPEVRNMFRVLDAGGSTQGFFDGVGTLVERGYEIGHVDFPIRGPYASGDGMVTLYSPFALTFPVPVPSLADADAMDALVAVQVAAQARYLQPDIVGGRLGTDETRAFAEALLYACPELARESCAEALGRLVHASGGTSAQSVKEAARVLHEVRERTPHPGDLPDAVGYALGLIEAPDLKDVPWTDRQALALSAVEFAETEVGRASPQFAERRDAFRTLAIRCRDGEQARRVYRALNDAEGTEPFAERLAHYERLSASGALTPDEVAAVFNGRIAGDTLDDSAARFDALRRALKTHSQEARAGEVHVSIRTCVRDAHVTLPQAQEAFMSALLYTHDADRAMAKMHDQLRPGREDLSIQDGAATVDIGGIRVPKRIRGQIT